MSCHWLICVTAGLLPDTQNCGLRMHRECRQDFPRHRLQRKPLVSDPGIHPATCVTHVPWWMPGSLIRSGRENVPGIPGACAPTLLRIWQKVNPKRLYTVRFIPITIHRIETLYEDLCRRQGSKYIIMSQWCIIIKLIHSRGNHDNYRYASVVWS